MTDAHRLICLLLFLTTAFGVQAHDHQSRYRFIENHGQWPTEVLSRAEISGGHLFLTRSGLLIDLWDKQWLDLMHHQPDLVEDPDHLAAHAVRMRFASPVNPNLSLQSSQPYDTRYSFFLGQDESRWAANLRAFASQKVIDLFPGIDWHFYQDHEDLKYDFILKPGVDTHVLKFEYQGADSVYIEHGNLWIKTSLGDIIEQHPEAYQQINGERVAVPVHFQISTDAKTGTRWISYDFPQGYDRSQTLVIDPLLIFSTFSGSGSDNWGNSATYGDHAALFSGGTVFGNLFPTTTGAYQVNWRGGTLDIGILKFDSTGADLLSATYLGGNGTEVPHSLLADFNGDLLILGTTSSTNFPVSANAFDRTFNFGGGSETPISGVPYNSSDIFITKLDSTLTSLRASTYLGGSDHDGLNTASRSVLNRNYGDELRGDIIIDSANRIFVTCVSQSSNFPTTLGAFDRTLGGNQDGIVAKFSTNLDTLVWATYLGGSALDAAYSLKIDPFDNIVVGGGTNSTDFPTTDSVLHTNFRGGSTDGFLSVLSPNGDSLVASTYLGTSSYDQVYLIDVDYNDSTVAVFGQTLGNYPVSQGVYSVNNAKQFVHKLSLSLDSTIFSTRVGSGIGNEVDIVPTAFLVSSCSNIFLSGWGGIINSVNTNYLGGTTSNLTTTPDAYQRNTNGNNFYFMVLSGDASERLYATFFGNENNTNRGDHVDGGTSRFDSRGIIYQAVCACSNSDFPTTPGAYSRINNSNNCNNVAIKYDLNILNAGFVTSSTDSLISGRAGCRPYPVDFENTSSGGQEFRWDLGDGTRFTLLNKNGFDHLYDSAGEFIVSMTAIDRTTCASNVTVYDTVTVFPTGFRVSDSAVVCLGDSARIFAATEAPSATYRWFPTNGLSNPNGAATLAAPDTSQIYQVAITTNSGCRDTLETQVRIVQPIQADFTAETQTDCDTILATRFTNLSENAATYEWRFGDGSTSTERNPVYNYGQTGQFLVRLIARDGPCFNQASDQVIVSIDQGYLNFLSGLSVSDDQTVCQGDTVQIFAQGANAYAWSPTQGLNDPTLFNPLASPDSTTTYQVRLTYQDSCFVDSTVRVNVLPGVQMALRWQTEGICGEQIPVLLDFLAVGANNFRINYGDGNFFSGSEVPPSYTYAESGIYDLEIIGENGFCSDTIFDRIVYEFVNPPNVFTPNGDAFNPVFDIGAEAASGNWQLEVYNRWGRQVYQADPYLNDWDGDDLTNGTYYYHLKSKQGSTCKGWLKIMR